MKNRIISLFIYLLPSLIYAQNNADDKYEILSLTDMVSLFKDSKNSVPQDYDEIYVLKIDTYSFCLGFSIELHNKILSLKVKDT